MPSMETIGLGVVWRSFELWDFSLQHSVLPPECVIASVALDTWIRCRMWHLEMWDKCVCRQIIVRRRVDSGAMHRLKYIRLETVPGRRNPKRSHELHQLETARTQQPRWCERRLCGTVPWRFMERQSMHKKILFPLRDWHITSKRC